MLEKAYLDILRAQSLSYADKRRDIIKKSDDILHHAKRAIFALHRQNRAEAEEKLKQCENIFTALHEAYAEEPNAWEEGAYRAAVEEYVEAILFYQFIANGAIGTVEAIRVEPELYIAGLCDLPGELYRYAIRAATQQDMNMVKKCADTGEEIVGELIEFNLTSYLRNKFDQAKQAVNRLEEVVYETSLHREH